MAVLDIITEPNKILRKKSDKVKSFDSDVVRIGQDLLDTVRVAKDPEGAGLAASQVGINKRICVVRNLFEDPANPKKILSEDFVLVNPKIISHSTETETDWEGCLSVPDIYGLVKRFSKIKVIAQNVNGDEIKIKASGLFSRVIQHEIDHLDGILFTDKVIGKTLSEKELEKLFEE